MKHDIDSLDKAQLELVQSMYSDLLKQTISSNVQNGRT